MKNPNVQRSPINQKQSFLRSKGLNETEIQIACDRAGVFTNDPNQQNDKTIINIGQRHLSTSYPPIAHQTTFGRIKEILNTVALISGITYAIYIFYKVLRKYVKTILNAKYLC